MAGGFSALPSESSGGTLTGVARIKGPHWARMPLVTVGMLGLQIVWSVEMSYASPYLLTLGLSKSWMSVVFVAGPLSGLVVQPLIGVLADQSRSKFGRRRPYILGGAFLCVFAIILLGFTSTFSGIFTSVGSRANRNLTIVLAVISIYCIDFSINAVQAADRALLVDLLPPSQQETGNAWAGRMFGVGSVAGFFVGNIDLPKVLPFLGRTELEVLSVITSICLLVTHAVTSFSVKEKVLVKLAGEKRGSILGIFRDIWVNMRTLPRTIKQICLIQFFAWIGWFPILFFSTVYLGELYTREVLANNPSLENNYELQEEATRAGSRALLWSSILTLASSILLPYIVLHSSDGERRPSRRGSMAKLRDFCQGLKMHTSTLWALSHLLFAITMGCTYFTTTVRGASFLITLTGFCWAVTQWVPFSLLGEAILLESATNSSRYNDSSLIPLSDRRTRTRNTRSEEHEREGLMFSVEEEPEEHHSGRDNKPNGVPKHANGFEHGRGGTSRGIQQTSSISSVDIHGSTAPGELRRSSSRTEERDRIDDEDITVPGRRDEEDVLLHNDSDSGTEISSAEGHGGDVSNKAGIILGIHNIFVVIPQFLVTGMASVLFAILEPSKSALDNHTPHPAGGAVSPANVTIPDAAAGTAVGLGMELGMDRFFVKRAEMEAEGGVDSVGLIFRIGGVSAAIAFVLCWKLSREFVGRPIR